MSDNRIAVKQKIILSRQEFRQGTDQRLFCDLCGTAFPSDLHEVLIERDDVKGAKLIQIITEAPENLQLLCNPCNIGPAKENSNRDKLVAKQIMRFGRLWLRTNLPQGASNHTEIEREVIIQTEGLIVLTRWINSVGMENPLPYILRVERVADIMLRSVYAKKAQG